MLASARLACAMYSIYLTFFIFDDSNFSWRIEAPGMSEMVARSVARLTSPSAKCGTAPTRLLAWCRERNLSASSHALIPIDAAETKHDVA